MLASPTSKKNINGILLLDKAAGITSNAALQQVKHLYKAKRAGHTGSLDPIATGMLPICFGEATKFSQFLLDDDKHYFVTVKLGIKTTTGDSEGEVVMQRPWQQVDLDKLPQIFRSFHGSIKQMPPMFSALKHQGKPLYVLARQGIEIERAPREIYIHALTLHEAQEDYFTFSLHCSKGTYVRTLVDDIGEILGCGAHVLALRRTAVAAYNECTMHSFTELLTTYNKDGISGLKKFLLPVDTAVARFPAVLLSTATAFYIRMGQPVRVTNAPPAGLVRLINQEDQIFLGIGEMLSDSRVQPKRVIASNTTY